MLLKAGGRNINLNTVTEWGIKSTYKMQSRKTVFSIYADLSSGKDFVVKEFEDKDLAESFLLKILTKIYSKNIIDIDSEVLHDK